MRASAASKPIAKQEDFGLTPERVREELVRLAMADPRRLKRPDGTLIPIHQLPEDVLAAVSAIEFDDTGGETKIKLWSAKRACALLRRLKSRGAA